MRSDAEEQQPRLVGDAVFELQRRQDADHRGEEGETQHVGTACFSSAQLRPCGQAPGLTKVAYSTGTGTRASDVSSENAASSMKTKAADFLPPAPPRARRLQPEHRHEHEQARP